MKLLDKLRIGPSVLPAPQASEMPQGIFKAEMFKDRQLKLFVLRWRVTALAAGITQLANANSLTIANNGNLYIRRISVYLTRQNAALAIQQAGSMQLQLSSSQGRFTDGMITSSIGAQWTTNPPTVFFQFSPDDTQIEVLGLNLLGGQDLTLNLTAFNFGTTVLNDVIDAQIHLEF